MRGKKNSCKFNLLSILILTATFVFCSQSMLSTQSLAEIDIRGGENELSSYDLKDSSEEERIAEIKIEGNDRIDAGAILLKIQNRSGDVFDPEQLREDLKAIFKMGYFNDVRIEIEDSEEGKIVTYIVDEKKVIKNLEIEGEEKIKEDELREVIKIRPNTIFNPKRLKDSVSNIINLYKEKGYYAAEVDSNVDPVDENKVNLTLNIDEGEKTYIREINISGNEALDDDEIKDVLVTSTKGWLSWITQSGLLKRGMLEHDSRKIAAFYKNKGFVDVKVSEPIVEKKEDGLSVTFRVEEGDRYRVGLVDMSGDLITDKDKLMAKTTIGDKKFFDQEALRADIQRLTDYYGSKGYAYAEIDPQIRKKSEARRVDINFHIKKDILVYVNRIVVKGNTRTRDKVIRREMTLEENEIYDATALRSSTERLQRTDFFKEVDIVPESTGKENLKDIIVNIKEKPTGTFSIGAGYSSVDGFMVMSEIKQRNLLGRGQDLSLQANIGGRNTRYNLNFTEPHLNDSDLLFGMNIYDWERDYDDYDKHSQGGSLRFGYPIWEEWRVYTSVGYNESTLSDIREITSEIIRDSLEIETTQFLTLGFSRDTTNRRFNPSRGSNHKISIKKAGDFMGGEAAYTKLEGTTSWYFSSLWDTVFHVKGSAGYVSEDEDKKLPVYERFYLGGLNSVRGFEAGDISPRDPVTDERIGGTHMGYINLEYIFPLVKDAGLNGVVFFDSGFVNREDDGWSLTNLRNSTGIGFRWMSPMGPLRLEWGYNLDPEEDEDTSVWDFSIGGRF
ncbi:MAG: outer membrane protein assembly factor BamA [Desulfurivibrionaceae bacterium]